MSFHRFEGQIRLFLAIQLDVCVLCLYAWKGTDVKLGRGGNGGGHWTVNFTCTQCFITMFSYSLKRPLYRKGNLVNHNCRQLSYPLRSLIDGAQFSQRFFFILRYHIPFQVLLICFGYLLFTFAWYY